MTSINDSLKEKTERLILEKAEEKGFTGSYEELISIIKVGETLGVSEALEPTDLVGVLREKKKKEDERTADLLGYRLDKFKQVEQDLDGLQAGLYVIGGDTNIGKTAFLINLFMDTIETNPHLYGLFFSLDDSTDIILNRILAIKANLPINGIRKPQGLDKQRLADRVGAYQALEALAGRFRIEDSTKIQDFTALDHHIREVIEGQGKDLIIAIDGLQNIDTGEGELNIREKNIARANMIKKLVTTYSVPILTTVELRKRAVGQSISREPSIDDIMETGKFAYNANLVWLLSLDDPDKREKISLRIGKNKLSENKQGWYLNFNRQTAEITETGETIGQINTVKESKVKPSKQGNRDYQGAFNNV